MSLPPEKKEKKGQKRGGKDTKSLLIPQTFPQVA
jgi:hypothetical protein